jgi:hypothetical protein
MIKERLPYSHVYPLGFPGRLQPITAQRFPVEFTWLRSTCLARVLGDVLARAHHPDGLPGVIDHHGVAGSQALLGCDRVLPVID